MTTTSANGIGSADSGEDAARGSTALLDETIFIPDVCDKAAKAARARLRRGGARRRDVDFEVPDVAVATA